MNRLKGRARDGRDEEEDDMARVGALPDGHGDFGDGGGRGEAAVHLNQFLLSLVKFPAFVNLCLISHEIWL